MRAINGDFRINKNYLKIYKNNKFEYKLPHLWMRDNCSCNDCRVFETQEKRFMLDSVSSDLKPENVNIEGDNIFISWPDSHKTLINFQDIKFLQHPRKPEKALWKKDFLPTYYDWNEFLQNNNIAIDAISTFIINGAICIKDAPQIPNTLEDLALRLGPLREVLFERIHNVSLDGHVYNIAHTSLEVPPHNDFASYSWPPSVQALHMLANDCDGGESMIVDGFSVLMDLKKDHPNFFDILTTFPIPFREFDETNETYAEEPIVRVNTQNKVVGFRFSNQLMQMINPLRKNVDLFYKAYHELCTRVNSKKYKSIFRLDAGHILLVSGHRVLHGRAEFNPNGKRHLQDAYYEMDNVENNLVVYRKFRSK